MDITFDQRTRTTLVCGAIALAIAVSMLLRGRMRKVNLLFAAFAGDVGCWYLSQSLFGFFEASVWERLRVVLAVLLPLFAVNLFEAMVPFEAQPPRWRLGRITALLAIPMVGLVLSPYLHYTPVRIGTFLYVFTFYSIGLFQLYQRGKRSDSRATQRRVGFLVVVGALAGLFTVADFAWVIGYLPAYHPPPVGVVFSVVFLFILAQALRHERLLDLYEMLGKLLVATAVAFAVAGVFYLLVTVIGGFDTMYLNAVVASIVVLVVLNPLREKVEQQAQRLVLRERRNLEKSTADARRRLTHVLEIDSLGTVVIGALERSRRVTGAALYLRLEDGTGFERLASLGPEPPQHIEVPTARAILEQLDLGPVVLEEAKRELKEPRVKRSGHSAAGSVVAAAEVLGSLRDGVVFGIRAEGRDLVGLLVITDARTRDAYSPEDIALVETLAGQIGVVVENSRHYEKMKERDRLAVLGQMAAGLAHEIRNPLGAIKGAAQLLADPPPQDDHYDDEDGAASADEFLGIILEEVDRLDQVVGSVLDLARQNTDVVTPIDVNRVARRTVQVMSAEAPDGDLSIEVKLDEQLPRAAIPSEQLQQVIMNLVRNAKDAMGGKGRISLATRVRTGVAEGDDLIEIAVSDTGKGISQKLVQSIFLPFFTTKQEGTGLGLAICQRIVQSAGGRIEVRTREGEGSTFVVVLPAAAEPAAFTPVLAPVAVPSSQGGSNDPAKRNRQSAAPPAKRDDETKPSRVSSPAAE